MKVFISHRFETNSNEARLVRQVIRKFDLQGIIVRGAEATPPWSNVLDEMRASCALITLYGDQASASVHNELGMAWSMGIPCFAVVDRTASYDFGIAGSVVQYERADFRRRNNVTTVVGRVARKIRKSLDALRVDIEKTKLDLYLHLAREPSVPEIAHHLRRTPELISQLVTPERSVDMYWQYDVSSRQSRMLDDLSQSWRTLGYGPLTRVNINQSGVLLDSQVKRLFRRSVKFHVWMMSGTSKTGTYIARTRNQIAQRSFDRQNSHVILILLYTKCPLQPIRGQVDVWRGITFRENVGPGVHYLGPGQGFGDTVTENHGIFADLVMPTFVLEKIVNPSLFTERTKVMIGWMKQYSEMVFPKPGALTGL